MNECSLPFRLKNMMENYMKNSLELKEKEMRYEFHYFMELARSELYEEFLNEVRKCELLRKKALRVQKEKNCKALKHLRVCLDAEHVQNLTQLELENEMQARKSPDKIVDVSNNESLAEEEQHNSEEPLFLAALGEIDGRLLDKTAKLLVFKKRLERLLSQYVNFVESVKPKYSSPLLGKQFSQAAKLLKIINKMETDKLREYRDRKTVCGQTKLQSVPQTSHKLQREYRVHSVISEKNSVPTI